MILFLSKGFVVVLPPKPNPHRFRQRDRGTRARFIQIGRRDRPSYGQRAATWRRPCAYLFSGSASGAEQAARWSEPIVLGESEEGIMVLRLPPSHGLRAAAAGLALLAAIAGVASTAHAATYHAYAPPNAFGVWVQVGAHANATAFSISATPVGATSIVGEVRYFGVDGREKIEPFIGSTVIRTCNCVATVQVRFKGIPLGSAVDVNVGP
jgi:hypothetical protein